MLMYVRSFVVVFAAFMTLVGEDGNKNGNGLCVFSYDIADAVVTYMQLTESGFDTGFSKKSRGSRQ